MSIKILKRKVTCITYEKTLILKTLQKNKIELLRAGNVYEI
jgi:hypothetical protein